MELRAPDAPPLEASQERALRRALGEARRLLEVSLLANVAVIFSSLDEDA